jgi:uncharacterized protein (TIGR02452 family)
MQIDRARAAQLGRETVQILREGRYQTVSGVTVDIRAAVSRAVSATISYPPETPIPAVQPGVAHTRIEVRNETTLAAAQRFVARGYPVVALNFASATAPGGGFLNGARAQEESLARSSGLYACLADNPMYAFHRARNDPLYTDYVIYSPDVPVIRTDAGTLLDRPYLCSFLTSPAVNANALLVHSPQRRPEIRPAMESRISKVLALAALHQHATLILGAWGCGAFGNDAAEIAALFHAALTTRYQGVFAQIVFAITDWSDDHRFIGPFERVFGQNTPAT